MTVTKISEIDLKFGKSCLVCYVRFAALPLHWHAVIYIYRAHFLY